MVQAIRWWLARLALSVFASSGDPMVTTPSIWPQFRSNGAGCRHNRTASSSRKGRAVGTLSLPRASLKIALISCCAPTLQQIFACGKRNTEPSGSSVLWMHCKTTILRPWSVLSQISAQAAVTWALSLGGGRSIPNLGMGQWCCSNNTSFARCASLSTMRNTAVSTRRQRGVLQWTLVLMPVQALLPEAWRLPRANCSVSPTLRAAPLRRTRYTAPQTKPKASVSSCSSACCRASI